MPDVVRLDAPGGFRDEKAPEIAEWCTTEEAECASWVVRKTAGE